jgi:hypothetical protein
MEIGIIRIKMMSFTTAKPGKDAPRKRIRNARVSIEPMRKVAMRYNEVFVIPEWYVQFGLSLASAT